MSNRQVTAHSQAELLRFLPRVTRFRFHNSIVGIAFRNGRSAGGFRFDLPGEAGAAAIAHAITAVAARCPAGSEFVFVITADGAHQPRLDVVHLLQLAFASAGLPIRELLWQTRTCWGCYFDECVQSLPDSARPEREHIESDAPVVSPRYAVSDLDVQRALRTLARVEPNRHLLGAAEAVLGSTPHPLEIAKILRALRAPALRDVILMHWAFGQFAGECAAREVRTGVPVSRSVTARWAIGRHPHAPASGRVESALTACARLRVLAGPETVAQLWAMEAWLNWSVGRATQACECGESALERDSTCTFAQLMTAYIRAGAVPDWAFAPASASPDGSVAR